MQKACGGGGCSADHGNAGGRGCNAERGNAGGGCSADCGNTCGRDEYFMREALKCARRAAAKGEAPVGAVVVKDGVIIARARNEREARQDATLHAEMTAIRRACKKIGLWRLVGCDIYVTLEPCPMCAGAIVLARLDRLVYGAADPKAGACGTVIDVICAPGLNHHPEVSAGVLRGECAALLTAFFRGLRK